MAIVGFAIGAPLAGIVADALGLTAAIWVVAGLTAASGVLVAVRMYETHPRQPRHPTPTPGTTPVIQVPTRSGEIGGTAGASWAQRDLGLPRDLMGPSSLVFAR